MGTGCMQGRKCSVQNNHVGDIYKKVRQGTSQNLGPWRCESTNSLSRLRSERVEDDASLQRLTRGCLVGGLLVCNSAARVRDADARRLLGGARKPSGSSLNSLSETVCFNRPWVFAILEIYAQTAWVVSRPTKSIAHRLSLPCFYPSLFYYFLASTLLPLLSSQGFPSWHPTLTATCQLVNLDLWPRLCSFETVQGHFKVGTSRDSGN